MLSFFKQFVIFAYVICYDIYYVIYYDIFAYVIFSNLFLPIILLIEEETVPNDTSSIAGILEPHQYQYTVKLLSE